MNLLELMLKERVIFPAYAQYAVQDYVGRIRFADKKPVCNEKYYEWEGCWCTGSIIGLDRLENWNLDIVTRDQHQIAGGSMAIEDDTFQLDEPDFEPFISVEDAHECKAKHAATSKQSAPKGSGSPILGMVLADLTNRALEGKEKYGEPLKAHNGRNALWDLYQELLDAAMYIRQAIEEQDA
jgi:hypothetical protein